MSENEQTEETHAQRIEREKRTEGKYWCPFQVEWAYHHGESRVVLRARDEDGTSVELTPEATKVFISQLKQTVDFAAAMAHLIPAAIETGADVQGFADAMSKINRDIRLDSEDDGRGMFGRLLGHGIFG